MPGMMKKSPTPKPKATMTPKPKASMTPKPKVTPMPKFTAPTLAQYKSSAAYKAGDMTYKEYIAVSKNVFDAKNKKK
jgi:hypothetical protein